MNRSRFLLRCLISLLLTLGLAFGMHSWIRYRSGLAPAGDLLPFTYLVNGLLAFAIVAGLYALRLKMRHQIGFLFIGGSLLKFLFFFIFFYPEFTADDTIDRNEFSSFFVPYFFSLLLETYFTSLMLRNLEEEHPG
jgi:hypothetical protein